jgi:hypothetical protein
MDNDRNRWCRHDPVCIAPPVFRFARNVLTPSCIIRTLREAPLLRAVALAALMVVAGSAQNQAPTDDEPGKPLDWPSLVSTSAGIQFNLRTAWRDGVLKYVATFSDEKGRIAKYLSNLSRRKGGPVLSSFSFSFRDGDGFLLGTVYIPNSFLSKDAGTLDFRAVGETQCAEKLYWAVVESWNAANAAGPSAPSTHTVSFPSELDEAPGSAKRKQ